MSEKWWETVARLAPERLQPGLGKSGCATVRRGASGSSPRPFRGAFGTPKSALGELSELRNGLSEPFERPFRWHVTGNELTVLGTDAFGTARTAQTRKTECPSQPDLPTYLPSFPPTAGGRTFSDILWEASRVRLRRKTHAFFLRLAILDVKAYSRPSRQLYYSDVPVGPAREEADGEAVLGAPS